MRLWAGEPGTRPGRKRSGQSRRSASQFGASQSPQERPRPCPTGSKKPWEESCGKCRAQHIHTDNSPWKQPGNIFMPGALIEWRPNRPTTFKKDFRLNYFASSDPHHGIQFIPSDILSGISSDILSGRSIWHSIWQIYLAFHLACPLTFYLAYLLTFYLAYLLTFYLAELLTFYLAFYQEYLLTFYLAYLLTLYLAFYQEYLLTFYLAYLLTFYLVFYLADISGILSGRYIWHSIWQIYLAFHLACLLTFYLAYLLRVYLADLLTFYLAYLLTFYLADISGIPSGMSSVHSIWHIFWQSIWHSIWQIFWHSIWHIFWHSVCHIFWHSIWHIFWHSLWHSIWICFWPLRSGWSPARPTALRLSPVEVRQGSLRSRAGSGGPSKPAAVKSWQMRSGEAHCDQELADEVRRGAVRSRAGSGGPVRRKERRDDN